MPDLPFTLHATSCLIYHSHYIPLHVWLSIHITCHFLFDLPFTLHAISCLLYHSQYMPLHVWLTSCTTCYFMSDSPFTLHATSSLPFTVHATSCLPFTLHATLRLSHHSHYMPLHMYFQQRGLWFLHQGTTLQIIQNKIKRSCIAISHEKNFSKFHTVYDKLTLGLGQHPYSPELIWQHVWPSEHSDFWSGQITLSALHRNTCTKCTLLWAKENTVLTVRELSTHSKQSHLWHLTKHPIIGFTVSLNHIISWILTVF